VLKDKRLPCAMKMYSIYEEKAEEKEEKEELEEEFR
jgi:hypothetical protein